MTTPDPFLLFGNNEEERSKSADIWIATIGEQAWSRADAITLPDALLALTRLCLLHYRLDERTTLTKLPQPDARQREILQALGVALPAI